MRITLKSHEGSLCFTCLVRATCNRLCRDQASKMVDNLPEYFFDDVREIIEKSGLDKEHKITLVVSAENTYSGLCDINKLKGIDIEV